MDQAKSKKGAQDFPQNEPRTNVFLMSVNPQYILNNLKQATSNFKVSPT